MSTATQKANQIVLIMTDTQRWDMINAYRHTGLNTPQLDRLASGGVRFDRAYCTQPVCGPARAGLFTGEYPHVNGGWTNSLAMADVTRTIGQRFQAAGFHTGYVGKWHLDGGDYFGNGVCPDGWDPDYWYDMRRYLDELTPDERVISRDQRTIRDPGITAEFTFGHRVSNRAIDFLGKHHDGPFLLVVSYDEPHHPYLCPPEYEAKYRDYEFPKSPNVWDTLEGKPEHQRAWAGDQVRRDRDAIEMKWPDYFACNEFVDDEIGRVLDAIDRHAPGALVVYTSDHGDGFHSHCLGGKGPAMYDEIARVPLLMRWPGVTSSQSVCPHPVSHIDIAPTLMTAAGLDVPGVMGGSDLTPALQNPDTRVNDAIFIEFGRYEIDHDGFGGFQPVRCAFDGRYKLVVNLLSSDELYDVVADPDEMTNLIDSPDHAAARDALHDRLLDWMNTSRDPFRGYYWERRPWRTDARPATWGYTGYTRQRVEEADANRQLDYATGLEITEYSRPK